MPALLASLGLYAAAAVAEIAGCFAFWAWLRRDASAWWLLPGILSLIAFAALLSRIDTDFAGRAYAAYGGVYILASLLWLWTVESTAPSGWDLAGSGLAIAGTLVILAGAQISR